MDKWFETSAPDRYELLKNFAKKNRRDHNEPLQQQNDQWRTEFMESKGYTVIRFNNEEISNTSRRL